MAVPNSMVDLSATALSNSPSGADSVTTATGPDEYLRALSAIVRAEQAQAAAVASAATVDLGAIVTGSYVHITGTVTIISFGTVAAGIERTVVFDGILTLTHNATSLILPTGANITTAAGDGFIFRSEGAGNWRCTSRSNAAEKAPLANAALTGIPSAPTAAPGTNTTQLATTAFALANALTQSSADARYVNSGADGTGTNIVNISTNTTLTAALHSGKQIRAVNAITLTMPQVNGFICQIIGSTSAVTLSASPGNIISQDGTFSTTYTIPASSYGVNAVTLESDGVNIRITGSSGRTIVAPAVNANEAVALGQVIGLAQTWQNLTASRAFGQTYTNSTGKPITVAVRYAQANSSYVNLIIAGVDFGSCAQNTIGGGQLMTGIVPDGATYLVTTNGNVLGNWSELR